jgi:hypothetical protein
MAFEHVGHGLTETLPSSPREGSAIDGGGRGGRRCSRARLAPSLAQVLNSNRLTAARISARESPQVLGGRNLGVGAAVRTGGGLCRPLSAPAQVSQQRWGVSDPACASQRQPRGRQRGRSRPCVSVEDVLGRVCRPCVFLSENPHELRRNFAPRMNSNVPSLLRQCSCTCCTGFSGLIEHQQIQGRTPFRCPLRHSDGALFRPLQWRLLEYVFAVAPIPILRERLGASRLRSLTLTASRP